MCSKIIYYSLFNKQLSRKKFSLFETQRICLLYSVNLKVLNMSCALSHVELFQVLRVKLKEYHKDIQTDGNNLFIKLS